MTGPAAGASRRVSSSGCRVRRPTTATSASSPRSTGSGRAGGPASPRASCLELLDERRQPVGVARGGVDRAGREVRAQARQRRAQLVAGVGGEAPRARERRLAAGGGLLQAREHRVEVLGELVDLDRAVARGHADAEVGGLGDLAGRPARGRCSGREREPRERARHERRREQRAEQRGEHDEPQAPLAVLERAESARPTCSGAPPGRSRTTVRHVSPSALTFFGVSPGSGSGKPSGTAAPPLSTEPSGNTSRG